jgi:hypothetical protein
VLIGNACNRPPSAHPERRSTTDIDRRRHKFLRRFDIVHALPG